MYSVIDISGRQYTVKEGDLLVIDKIDKQKDDKIEFDKIVLVKTNKESKIGQPFVNGAKVIADVVDQVRDDKVYAFKYKARKNSKKLKGHKQPYTLIKINKIISGD